MDSTNAAARLHDALEAYEAARSGNSEIPLRVWQNVLGHEDEFDTMIQLQGLGALVPDVVRWAEDEGPQRLRSSVHRHAPTWMSVLSPGLTMTVQSTSFRVHDDALTPLASAAALMDLRTDTSGLTERERQSAQEQLRKLRDEIINDENLPEDLRRALLDRLHEIESALEVWETGGEGALAASLERLAGVVVLAATGMAGPDSQTKYSPTLARVAEFVGGVYSSIAGVVTLKEGAQLALYAGEAIGTLPPGTAGLLGP